LIFNDFSNFRGVKLQFLKIPQGGRKMVEKYA